MKGRLSIACWRAIALLGLIVTIGCGRSTSQAGATLTSKSEVTATVGMQARTVMPAAGGVTIPRPDHVVIVLEENHAYSQIIGLASAPYINALASQGAVLTNAHAVTHPSEPNYLALFAGSTFGLTSDGCPQTLTGANLAQELIQAGDSFGGYAESMPRIGYTGCSFASYARKHNPWVNFTNVPSYVNMPLTSFPSNYRALPTISMVIPNLQNDMHDGTIEQADGWLKSHIDSYVQWAKANKSLLIITWDEDDGSMTNQIPTILVGSGVKVGRYSEYVNHYRVLKTLEAMYTLPYANQSATETTLTDIWQR